SAARTEGGSGAGAGGRGGYFCSACSQTFASAPEALKHRRSLEHKLRAQQKRCERGLASSDSLARPCKECSFVAGDILELKAHMAERHPDLLYQCSKCGAAFALHQEVSRHVREKACVFASDDATAAATTSPGAGVSAGSSTAPAPESASPPPPPPPPLPAAGAEGDAGESLGCARCPFRTASRAELLFHEVIHDPPAAPTTPTDPEPRYRCPECERVFKKHVLRWHLCSHTDEKPFICDVCYKGFNHRSSMRVHRRTAHPPPPPPASAYPRKRPAAGPGPPRSKTQGPRRRTGKAQWLRATQGCT
ncbi:Zinc finger protein, partial [Gryllus bimaculatus]